MLPSQPYGPARARRVDIMSTPEKEQMLNAHYEQKYAQIASDHCFAERETLKSHCKQVGRDLRREFQIVQEGIINHCT